MADPIGTTAAEIQALSKDIQDLGKQWDEIARRFSEGDLNKLLKIDKASADMQKFMHAINGTTAAELKMHRVEKELERALQKRKKALRELREEKEKIQKNAEEEKRDYNKFEKVKVKEIEKAIKSEKRGIKDIQALKQPEHLAKLTEEFDDTQRMMQVANVKAFIFKKTIEGLVKIFTGVYNWTERLQKNLATLAERFGSATDAIVGMNAAAKSEFLSPTGLGGMGFSIEEITSKLGDFREQMEFTGKITDQQAIHLIKFGMAAGISAQQVGEFSRAIVIMGGGAEETSNFLLDVGAAAKKSGVTAAALSKQFLGAGKSLFELTGPAARRSLTESAALLARMGTGLDKLKSFTDLTDSFDKTTESMAQLNTVFGTHINAMEVFSEQDPAKRWMSVIKAMTSAGMNPNLIRQEKKFLMDKLNISEEVANAGLRAAETGGDLTEELKKQADIERERLTTQKRFDAVLERGKKVLIAWEQLATNFYDKFESSGLIVRLKGMFEKIMDVVQSDGMSSFIRGLTGAFEIVSDIVNFLLAIIGPVLKPILWVVGKALELISAAWKLLKFWSFTSPGDTKGQAEAAADVEKAWGGFIGAPVGPAEGAISGTSRGPSATSVLGRPSAAEAEADVDTLRASRIAAATAAAPVAGGTTSAGAPAPAAAAAQSPMVMQPSHVQVQLILDGEVLQDRLYKANLRRNS